MEMIFGCFRAVFKAKNVVLNPYLLFLGINSPLFKCLICDSKFKYEANLKNHQLKKHPDTPKNNRNSLMAKEIIQKLSVIKKNPYFEI